MDAINSVSKVKTLQKTTKLQFVYIFSALIFREFSSSRMDKVLNSFESKRLHNQSIAIIKMSSDATRSRNFGKMSKRKLR